MPPLNTDKAEFRRIGDLFIGPVYFPEVAGAATAELRVGNLTAPCEIHTEGGSPTGYSGVGARNDRLQDPNTGVTLSGAAMVVYGSASPSTYWGRPVADVAVFTSAGALGKGAAFGSGSPGKPVWMGTANQDGAHEAKLLMRASYKTLVDGVTASFAKLKLPVGGIAAGSFDYAVYCVTAGAYQIRSGKCSWNAFNRTGAEVPVFNAAVLDLPNLESGTLAVTFSFVTSGANEIEFAVNANSSLTPLLLALQVTHFPVAGAGEWDIDL